MRTFLLCTLIIALSLGTPVNEGRAQQPADTPELPVQVDVDQATFMYSGEESLLEIYISFGAPSLDYRKRQHRFRASLPVNVALTPSTEKKLPGTPVDPVWTDSTRFRFSLKDTTGLTAGQHFIQQMRTRIAPGSYTLQLSIPAASDGSRKALALRRDVKVPSYAEKKRAALSDLILASSIERSNQKKSPFYKNGLLIRPNANQLYGKGLPHVFYYAEAYQPGRAARSSDEYTIYAYVARAGQLQPVQGLKKRYRRQVRSPDVIVGSFNISDLPSGSYFLRLVVLDENNEAAAQQASKFFVFNPDIKHKGASESLDLSFKSSPFASMPKEKVESELKQIRLVANAREKHRIDRLDELKNERHYLLRFWQRRDPNPSTVTNEARRQFKQKVMFADERYSSNFAEGWETDRGRVLLKYGRPSQVTPHLYESTMPPYEVWKYDNISGEGQSKFIFADRQGYGRFDLIHSDVRGEVTLPNWKERLRTH